MRTKRVCVWICGGLFVAASAAQAQGRQEIAAERAAIESERHAIVAANLSLTEEQAKVFWPLFRDYRAEMAKLGDRAVELLIDYAKHLETMTDAQATAMLDEYLAIQAGEVKVKTAWAPKLRQVLPPKVVTRLFQIENKLDTVLRFEAAAQIPLVDATEE